jgi:Carboxypeptidase regulatory-like domain
VTDFCQLRVTLRPGTHDQRAGVTGDNGEVAFDDLAAGRYAYRVQALGYPPLRAAAALELAAGEMRRLELQVADHDRDILGRVLDQHGVPVAGLEVRARLYRAARAATLLIPRSQAEQRDETSVDGSFGISGLQDGEYELRTLADGLHESAKAIVRAGADAVVLTVAEHAELRIFGQVASAAGDLLAGASVAQFGSPSRRTRTDEEGRYELLLAARNRVGHDRITFRADGYLTERLDVVAAEPDTPADLRLDATLEPISQTVLVEGHLIDERGGPVTGERVSLYSPRLGTHYQALSSADGSAVFPAVAASPDYVVRISPRGPYKGYAAPLDLSVDTSELEICWRRSRSGGCPAGWSTLRARRWPGSACGSRARTHPPCGAR